MTFYKGDLFRDENGKVYFNDIDGEGFTEISMNSSEPSYKVYVALLNQFGTNAPVATVLENTLGGIPTWSYAEPGKYNLVLNSTFTLNKTFVRAANGGGYRDPVGYFVSAPDQVQFTAEDDEVLVNTSIEIRVYP